jgi:hypothetical protein
MTERTQDRQQVYPVAGRHLRASDADRDQVANLLSTAFAEGRLSRDEHDERMDQLLRAKTFDDLVNLTRDLVVATPDPTTTRPPAAVVNTSAPHDQVDRMVAVFSGTERKGRWRVRRQIQALAVFGGFDLDMREAIFEAPVVEVSGFWCFGGLEIKVPEGVEVRNEVMGVFGGSDVKDVGDPQPGAPVLVVKGLALFGGVSVRGPKTSGRRGASSHGHRHGCGGRRRH